MPATPIMQWLKERGGPIGRFSQAMLLRVPAGLSEEHLAAALQVVLDHHDALRLRLTVGSPDAGSPEDGEWRLEIAPPGSVAAGACLRRVDVGALDERDLRGAIAAEADAAEARLAPAAGLMLQAVWFDAGAERAGRLLLTIHHLAVDGVSWRILVPDLGAAWQAISRGQTVALPARGTSFRRWAERLWSHARDESVGGELSFWSAMAGKPSLLLVEGRLDPSRDTLGSAGHLTLTLPGAVTQALLTQVPAAFHGGINDVLLTGLTLAVADWCRRHVQGGPVQGAGGGVHPVANPGRGANHGAHHGASHAVLLDLEGHGREEVLGREGVSGEVDLTRTVGWFTSLHPVRLDPGLLDLDEALSGGAALGRALKTIKEQLRAVPGKGLGYGLLRYLNPETAGVLAGLPVPQLGFNYLGRFAAGDAGADWAPSGLPASPDELGGAARLGGERLGGERLGGERLGGGDPAMPLAHAIEIDALTLDGAAGPVLTANVSFASSLLDEAAVRDLAETWFRALEALVRHVARPGAGGRTPSDLALVDLTQDEIERLESDCPQIEDILPLSPLQEGLLFHALYDAQGPDVYTVQLELELEGALDAAVLEASLQAVVGRHASLRAGFRHERLGRPVQVVLPRVAVPWRLIDLSGLDDGHQRRRLAEILEADRLERFDLAVPPLMRFALIRLSFDRHRLLISNHHLLMDGWSAPVLVRELLQAYAQRGSVASLPRATPYRDYLSYIAGQDREAGLAAWRETLAGLEEGTRLAPRQAGGAPVAPGQIVLLPGGPLSAGLNRMARERAVTLNTVLQALWGVLLGRLTGRDDVVFGVTVAGRPAEIAGVEHMVGLFINTLPLRMELPPQLALSDLLRRTQDRQSRLMAHQHIGLSEIQQAAGLGELFDTLLVFENYPVDRAGLASEEQRPQARPGAWPRRHALSAGADRAAGRGAASAARLAPRPVRARHGGGAGGAADPAAAGGGCRSGAGAGDAAGAGGVRARHHPAAVERHLASAGAFPDRFLGGCVGAAGRRRSRGGGRAARRAGDAAGAVCGAGRAHAGRHGGDLRRPQAELRRAGRPRQPPGASSARSRRRAGDGGGAVRGALAGDGGGAHRHPQGRRRLPAAGSQLPARAARLHAGRRGRPGAGDAVGAARPAAGRAARPDRRAHRAARRRLGRRSRASPQPRRSSRSTRTTPPMSSTPPDPPERRRA